MFKTLSSLQGNSVIAQQSLQTKEVTEETSPIIKLYPNPSKGQFMIELRLPNNVKADAKIELVNMMGQTVSTENASVANSFLQKRVAISSSLASGIFMVRVMSNNKTYLAKLIYGK